MSVIGEAITILDRVMKESTPPPWNTDASFTQGGEFMSANVTTDQWDIASFGGANVPPDEGREDRARADRALFLISANPAMLKAILGGLILANMEPASSDLRAVGNAIATTIVAADKRLHA